MRVLFGAMDRPGRWNLRNCTRVEGAHKGVHAHTWLLVPWLSGVVVVCQTSGQRGSELVLISLNASRILVVDYDLTPAR